MNLFSMFIQLKFLLVMQKKYHDQKYQKLLKHIGFVIFDSLYDFEQKIYQKQMSNNEK